ncbi:FAD/NAD(P)-binding protein [Devosia naphthalenivorans]|uniref:FAD/NAD(P)-binding protein n=1 Tax=Devosia naphthalenivorans TaxID=2082392 RepID=UPI000D35E7FC|nr:FAD/NAD(P)-binding protein [Devosia naphthalenivorans]
MSIAPEPRSITIIGGGASGVLLAAHLLRDQSRDVHVTLIERRGEVGQGLAYSATSRDHRVNVPARGMSAFADEPDHFWRWLQARDYPSPQGSWVFVPRRLYGVYLEDVLQTAGQARPGRLVVRSDEAIAVRQGVDGIETVLGDGTSIPSNRVVLAVGHETQAARSRGIAVRVGSEQDTPLPTDAEVMILGSGLSMVDAWISLAEADHRGPIMVVSRNGLLPKGHRDVQPLVIDPSEVPLGASLTKITRWARNLVRKTEAEGGDWRSVVDGLRPYNQRIWQSWPEHTRRQFLRHLRPWWNILRHRLPPELHNRLSDAIARGQVRLVAAEFLGVASAGTGAQATIRRRGTSGRETVDIARVYDCGGVSVNVETSSNAVVRDLVGRGIARPDALHIGLDVSPDCQLVDRDGSPSVDLLAVGPLTRGQFFEIEAIPDIRIQCAKVAERLLSL